MPDVNVLVYAHRVDEAVHPAYRRWVDEMVNGPDPFALSVLSAVGFVRIVTNRKIYPQPTPIAIALAAVDQIVAQPRCRLIAPGPSHWGDVARLCRATGATGKLVADAQHAALAIAENCTWVSRDSDFTRFAAHGLSFQHLVLS